MATKTTAAELIQQLSQLPSDAIILMTADHVNGAWSKFELRKCTVALDSDYCEGSHHILIFDDAETIAEHREDHPEDVIVTGYHLE